jgi:hypothetical protein
MLTDLQTAHAEVLRAIDGLAVEVGRDQPDTAALSAARLALTKASRLRQALLQCRIYPRLHDIAPSSVHAIDALRQEDAANLVASSQHIGRWTMATILADWAGYRRASDLMRRQMRQRVERERAILYPLLTDKAA